MSGKRAQLIVLGVLVGVAAAIPVWRHIRQAEQYRAVQARLAGAKTQSKKRFAEYKERLAAEQRKARALVEGPAERSEWLEAGREPYLDAVRASGARLVVVPPMDDPSLPGIDATARVTIARRLAARIAVPGEPFVDPGLVFRALGEPRAMSFDEIRSKLAGTAIHELVTGTVSQDGKGNLRIVLVRRALRGDGSSSRQWEKSGLHVDDTALPEDVVGSYLGEALPALGLRPAPSGRPPAYVPPAALALSRSPLAAMHAHTDPISELWLQQLFALLAPDETFSDGRTRERIFERTLAALDRVDTHSADYAILKARALAYLGRRPAAAELLEEDHDASAEAQALLDYVQSNLTGLKQDVRRIRRPLPKLMAELELFAMRYSFGDMDLTEQRREGNRIVGTVPADWKPVIGYYLTGFGTWNLPSAWPIKMLLDQDFPVSGYRAEDVLAAKAALGANPADARTSVDLELAPLVHARKWRVLNEKRLCCGAGPSQWVWPEATQYVDLLSARADALAVARLQFLWDTQGLEQRALDLATLYDDELFGGGNPQVEVQKLLARLRLVGSDASPAQRRIVRQAYEDLWRIIAWLPGQSWQTGYALGARRQYAFMFLRASGYNAVMSGMRPPDAFTLPRAQDIPLRSEFILGMTKDPHSKATRQRDLRLLAVACDHSILDFVGCEQVDRFGKDAELDAEATQMLASLIGRRFEGLSARSILLAQVLEREGRTDEAEVQLRQAVASAGAQEDPYISLAKLLLRKGDFSGAQKAYLRYPGLKHAGEGNTVGLSIYAHRAGSAFLRRGLPKLALPFVRIAAMDADGSSANLQGQADAAILDRDYARASERLEVRYRRYEQSDVISQLSGLSFIRGRARQGWALLSEKLPDEASLQPFLGAAVGFRIEQASPERIISWVDGFVKEKRYLAALWARQAAFDAMIVDRNAREIAKVADVLQDPSVRESSLHAPPGARLPVDYFRVTSGIYGAFKAKDYERVIAGAGPLTDYYQRPLVEALWQIPASSRWITPYVAFALLRKGDVGDAQKLIADPKKGIPPFEVALIKAEISALAGNYAAAEAALRHALGVLPLAGNTPVPAGYAFAEIGEALYAATMHKAFLAQALDFATGVQAYHPWDAWAYAFEALHATSTQRRIRAAGIAQALDPQSNRLAQVPESIRRKGREWFEHAKPFTTKPPERTTGSQKRV